MDNEIDFEEKRIAEAEIKKATKEARKEVREEAKARKDSYKFRLSI